MRRKSRFILLVFALIIGAVLFVLFGRYPSTGIPDDTVAISVSTNPDEDPVFRITDESELSEAREAAGTIWNQVGYNSLDERPLYWLTLTRPNGVSESFWINATQWSNHGRTPADFYELIEEKKPNKAEMATPRKPFN